MTTNSPDSVPRLSKPEWLKVKFPAEDSYFSVSALLRKHGLNTICRSAQCPNRSVCWTARTATFLILGEVCTRRCSFCAVAKGAPGPPAADEPERVAAAAADLGLDYVVLTSVTRDDLPDGGASAFAATVRALRARRPEARVEVLIPDFGGRAEPLRTVIAAGPDIVGHNLETTASFYPRVGRPAEGYSRSLEVLRRAKALGAATKSGLMIGLGETEDEIRAALDDLRGAGCDLLTLGQYLQPSRAHAPVARYYTPAEFEAWRREALDRGFAGVESGPLVRSSFHAHQLHDRFRSAAGQSSCAT